MALPPSDLDCPRCYPVTIDVCDEDLTLSLGLDANTAYTVLFEDMFGNQYDQDVISDGDGDIIVDLTTADFPEGLFATPRNLQIAILTQYLVVVTWTIEYYDYDSICLTIQLPS